MRYNLVHNDDEQSSISAFFSDGRPLVAASDHPNFDRIVDALVVQRWDDEAKIASLFDITLDIREDFEALSDRVLVQHGRVFFDGESVNDFLAESIVRFHAAGEPFMPLVRFLEKIQDNPNEHSKEHAYRWLSHNSFIFTDDGDILCYKGVSGTLQSISSGDAIVDGKGFTNSTIPNYVGSIVSMPRSAVEHDPTRPCSTGLHVGTYDYAAGWGNVVIRVKVNPRDIVSVPVDSNARKMRVCRYAVIDQVTEEDTDTIVYSATEEDTYDYCDVCGSETCVDYDECRDDDERWDDFAPDVDLEDQPARISWIRRKVQGFRNK